VNVECEGLNPTIVEVPTQSSPNRTVSSVDDGSKLRQVRRLVFREALLTVVGDAGLDRHKAIGTSPSVARIIPVRSQKNG